MNIMADTADIVVMCSNCMKRPVADVVKCGFTDWCNLCDDTLFSTRLRTLQKSPAAGSLLSPSTPAMLLHFMKASTYLCFGRNRQSQAPASQRFSPLFGQALAGYDPHPQCTADCGLHKMLDILHQTAVSLIVSLCDCVCCSETLSTRRCAQARVGVRM